ncbi:unnamed protein product [Brachionus calyciflorus]|uniref:Nitrogen permease regulator 2-like protein n=1 Tax=Brachionus calyciflorus TaxID=104777 RepID=A0A813SG16_9BILA|nr:unnamed protein product [Brachionus calyciflorus]
MNEDYQVSDHGNNTDEKILALMFCEFDIEEGPKIKYQKPYDVINKVIFESISPYIIPKLQLKNKIITVTVGKYKICGFPICIEQIKYKRNIYIFNICFIFDKDTNICSYEAVVKKLACDLRTLEVESEFLSNDQLQIHLPKILEQIQRDLNKTGECIIHKIANLEHSAIFLKLIINHSDPQLVQSCDVPVFIRNHEEFEIDEWDLTTQKIVSAINGFKTVSLIANETNIESSVAKEAIQNLLYLGIVSLVPIIQFSSMFITTPQIANFYSNYELQMDAVRFVQLDKEREPPIFYDIFKILNMFNHGFMVKNVNELGSPHEKNIDLKKLILFGLIKRLLRKINKYPISLDDASLTNGTELSSEINLPGDCSYDKLCSQNRISIKKIEETLDKLPNVIVCIK